MNTITIENGSNQFVCSDIGNLEGFESPDTIIVVEDVAKLFGAKYITSKYGKRRFSWRGLLKEDMLESRRDLIAACDARSEALIKFTTCDGLALQIPAVLKLVAPYRLGKQTYLVEAIAADSRFVGQTLNEFETAQTVISGGAQIPATIPMSLYSSAVVSNVVVNDGNAEADPVFIIHGSGTHFTIGNQTTDQEFQIEYTLGSDDYIEVDVANRTVLLNGETSIYSYLEGDFWTLQPGNNTIRFVVTGADENTLLTIQSRDSYIGI